MTTVSKAQLRFISFCLVIGSLFFYLESGGIAGWKRGMSCLLLSVVVSIDTYLAKDSKFFRLAFGSLVAMFLFFAVDNFMAH